MNMAQAIKLAQSIPKTIAQRVAISQITQPNSPIQQFRQQQASARQSQNDARLNAQLRQELGKLDISGDYELRVEQLNAFAETHKGLIMGSQKNYNDFMTLMKEGSLNEKDITGLGMDVSNLLSQASPLKQVFVPTTYKVQYYNYKTGQWVDASLYESIASNNSGSGLRQWEWQFTRDNGRQVPMQQRTVVAQPEHYEQVAADPSKQYIVEYQDSNLGQNQEGLLTGTTIKRIYAKPQEYTTQDTEAGKNKSTYSPYELVFDTSGKIASEVQRDIGKTYAWQGATGGYTLRFSPFEAKSVAYEGGKIKSLVKMGVFEESSFIGTTGSSSNTPGQGYGSFVYKPFVTTQMSADIKTQMPTAKQVWGVGGSSSEQIYKIYEKPADNASQAQKEAYAKAPSKIFPQSWNTNQVFLQGETDYNKGLITTWSQPFNQQRGYNVREAQYRVAQNQKGEQDNYSAMFGVKGQRQYFVDRGQTKEKNYWQGIKTYADIKQKKVPASKLFRLI